MLWIGWGCLAFGVLAGVGCAYVAAKPTIVGLVLKPGERVAVSAFRLMEDRIDLSMEFKRASWTARRPELGEWATTTTVPYLQFPNPGAAIKVSVSGPLSTAMFEAFPVSSRTATSVSRDLHPFVDDGDAHRFTWPPGTAVLAPSLGRGTNVITVTVSEVEPPLLGEHVALVVHAPLDLKTSKPGYGLLWWFLVWPIWALGLVGSGAIVLWLSLRKRSANVA